MSADKFEDLKKVASNASHDEQFQASEKQTDIIPGSEGVTQHEFDNLRHVTDSFPFSAFLVVVVEFAERFSYYGTTNIFNNYIRAPLPRGSKTGAVVFDEDRAGGIAGALNRGQQTSFAIRTFNTFFVYTTPFLGAILADTLWGRYKTLMIFSIVCLIGHIILVGGSSPASIANNDAALALLIISIVIMAVGAGSIKANVSPLIAEQYTGKLRKQTTKDGEEVIVSPTITVQRIYLWFYAAINFGACGSISASFIARDHGYWVAFLVPTLVFVIIPIVLFAGKNKYVQTPPRGSVILETLRVIGYAMGPAWSFNLMSTYKYTRREDFWDAAKPSSYPAGQVPQNMTWDDEFVGEVARTCNACAVFLFFPFFWLCYSQIDGNLGTTAAGMTLNGSPNDLIQNLNPIGIIVMVPIFDFVVYPFLRRRGIDFTPIKRIFTGFIVAGLAMTYASVLQWYINKTSPCAGTGIAPSECITELETPNPSPLNVWIVAGPYLLVGMAEIFASITSLEYAFTKAPARMRSVVMAISQFMVAFSAAINFALTAVNVEAKFVWLYGSFGVVAWIVGFIFLYTFRNLDKLEHKMNAIGKGDRAGFADERSATNEKL